MTRALINELREPPTEPVRLPRVGGPLAGETTLAEANDASFRLALQSLTRLVPGHAFGTWGQNVDSGTLSVAQGGSLHQRFDRLFEPSRARGYGAPTDPPWGVGRTAPSRLLSRGGRH